VRRLVVVGGVVLGLAVVSFGQGHAAPAAGSMYIRGGFDYSGHSLDDLDHYTGIWNRTLLVSDMPAGFDNVGWAPGFEFEGGYHFTPELSAGIGFSYGKHSRKNASSATVNIGDAGALLRISDDLGASISEITGNVAYWPAAARGLFIGAQAGMGFGKLTEDMALHFVSGDLGVDTTASGEFTGSGFVGGAFAGYQAEFGSGFSAFGKLGYKLRNLGKFKGRYHGEPADHDYAGLQDFLLTDSKKMEFNYSGMFFTVGLGVSFGGKR